MRATKRDIWKLDANEDCIRVYKRGELICLIWRGEVSKADPRVPKYILKECIEIFNQNH
jgi:hypothetical protein